MNGIESIAAERTRQIEEEGWTAEHDNTHHDGALAAAAMCYAGAAHRPMGSAFLPSEWPWSAEWWKPKTRRENLLRAGALIAAEIDRLDRAVGAIPRRKGHEEKEDR